MGLEMGLAKAGKWLGGVTGARMGPGGAVKLLRGLIGTGIGTGGAGCSLGAGKGLGWVVALQEGWRKHGGRRWSTAMGGDFRPVIGQRKIEGVGRNREDKVEEIRGVLRRVE